MTAVEPFLMNTCTMISTFLNTPVVLLESMPTVVIPEKIFVIAPTDTQIRRDPMISTSSMIKFPIEIYEVIHVQNVGRQKDVQENILTTEYKADKTIDKIFGRNGTRNICGMNFTNIFYGTISWVVDTKVFTAYKITVSCTGIIDD